MNKKAAILITFIYMAIGAMACGKAVEGQPQSQNIPSEVIVEGSEVEMQENIEEEASAEIIRTDEAENGEYVQYESDFIVFTHPENWIVEEIQGEDGRKVIFSDLSEESDPILVYDVGGEYRVDLEKTRDEYEKMLNWDYQKVDNLELSDIVIGGFGGQKLRFTYVENEQEFVQIRYMVVEGVRSHEFWYTYPVGMEADYQGKIEKVIETINFIGVK